MELYTVCVMVYSGNSAVEPLNNRHIGDTNHYLRGCLASNIPQF